MSTVIAKNVQVGADGTPSNNFTVYQPATPDGTLRIGNGNSGTTSNLVTVNSSGDVGIGGAPSTRLHTQVTNANLEIRATTVTSGDVRIGFDASGAFYNWIQTQRSSGAMQFAIANAERARIDTTGQRSTVILNGSTLYPAYDCRAWVNFNGTGVVAIRASGNVTSITDNGTGDYTVNFTTAMADASYAVNVSWAVTATETGGIGIRSASARPVSSSSARVLFNTSSAAGNVDGEVISVAIFR